MLKPNQVAEIAEHIIVEYVANLDCNTNEDIANVLEMLISKAAKAIEKTNGTERAKIIIERTDRNLRVH